MNVFVESPTTGSVNLTVTFGRRETPVAPSAGVQPNISGRTVSCGRPAVPAGASYAPVSQWAPCGRVAPRWSFPLTGALVQVQSFPASIATLPAPRAIVRVGPPFAARAPRWRSS